MYYLIVYIPISHLEAVKQALFEAGAGKFNHYDCACWQTKGTGQYRPLEGSSPYQGEQGKLETCEEYKLELIIEDQYLKAVMDALKKTHPYEEPAFAVIKIEESFTSAPSTIH